MDGIDGPLKGLLCRDVFFKNTFFFLCCAFKKETSPQVLSKVVLVLEETAPADVLIISLVRTEHTSTWTSS